MAVLEIIKNANQLDRGHSLSLAQVKSDGGIRKAQKRGPLLYNVNVSVNPMYDNSDAYYGIENEVMNGFKYGLSTMATQLPSTEVKNRGTWSGTTILVKGASQAGTSINLDGFSNSTVGIVKANDWLQFAGSTKVYQVIADASSDASGNVAVTLNTPLVGTIADNAVVTVGNNVEFKFALVNPGSVDPVKTPAGSHSFAQWGVFEFEEVL